MQDKQVDHLQKLKQKVSTPEGVPRLFDLVRVQDERMKLAFFAALGNTIVAKDIDQVALAFFMFISLSPSLFLSLSGLFVLLLFFFKR